MNSPKIQVYNTFSRNKGTLQTMTPGRIGIYVCGITVYDFCHLGHARVMVFFDSITRYLRDRGYEVHYVRNITDIDDKIFARANERQCHFSELTETFIKEMHQDLAAIHCLPPDDEPRVTQYIPQIIAMIERLLKREYAYITSDGDVYYRIKKYNKYGQLSGKKIDELLTGVRIESNHNKENPLDFALWKAAKEGEANWQSPWSKGRPGWHIECSTMSTNLLGSDFDIHGGGHDLIFPHHENEIAQSCGAYDCGYAHYWMHVAPLRVAGGAKMSKSLGNFFTIRELLTDYRAEQIRFFLARTHYRSPVEFNNQLMQEAGNALDRLYQAITGLTIDHSHETTNEYDTQFHQAMHDDFNTPQAIAVLFSLVRQINNAKANDPVQASRLASQLVRLGQSIGLMLHTAEHHFTESIHYSTADTEHIETLIAHRNTAKQHKDFVQADAIRQQLLTMNIIVEDSPQGTSWRRKRYNTSYDRQPSSRQ